MRSINNVKNTTIVTASSSRSLNALVKVKESADLKMEQDGNV